MATLVPSLGACVRLTVMGAAVAAVLALRWWAGGGKSLLPSVHCTSGGLCAGATHLPFINDTLSRRLSYAHTHVVHARLLFAGGLPGTPPLCADYSFDAIPIITGIADPRNAGTAALYLAAAGAAAWSVRVRLARAAPSPDNAVFMVGAGAALSFFLLASHVFTAIGVNVAERLLYMPSIGACVLLAHALRTLAARLAGGGSDRTGARVGSIALWAVVAVMAHATVARNRDWASEVTLWERDAGGEGACARDSARALSSLAWTRMEPANQAPLWKVAPQDFRAALAPARKALALECRQLRGVAVEGASPRGGWRDCNVDLPNVRSTFYGGQLFDGLRGAIQDGMDDLRARCPKKKKAARAACPGLADVEALVDELQQKWGKAHVDPWLRRADLAVFLAAGHRTAATSAQRACARKHPDKTPACHVLPPPRVH